MYNVYTGYVLYRALVTIIDIAIIVPSIYRWYSNIKESVNIEDIRRKEAQDNFIGCIKVAGARRPVGI